jgi:hypothetical protein
LRAGEARVYYPTGDAMKGWGPFALALGGLVAALPAAGVELDLPKHRLDGGRIDFEMDGPVALPELPIDREGPGVETAQTPSFKVYADLDEIEYSDRSGYVRYRFYVEPRSGAGGVERWTAKAVPSGRFKAQRDDVAFELTGGPALEEETIRLPLFSLEAPDYVEASEWKEPQELELSGETPVGVALTNLLTLPVTIRELRQPQPKGLWSKAVLRYGDAASFAPLRLAGGGRVPDLRFELDPGPRATLRALFPRSSKSGVETVEATLEASLPWEGLPTETVTVSLPVKFIPWPPTLFLVVAVGTLFGSLLPAMLRHPSRRSWARALVVSLIVGCLLEAAAMALDTELKLLNLQIDPHQMLPVFLMGATLGMLGFKSAEVLQRFFPFGGGKRPSE